MWIRSALFVFVTLALAPVLVGQSGPAPTPPSDDEAVVIERARTAVTFEADGRQVLEVSARMRVATNAGLDDAGTIAVPYIRELGPAEFRVVRVSKPDGRMVDTPVASALDVPAEVTQSSPTFTDAYVKTINVRGLEVGDVVEYDYVVRQESLLPGHFWFDLTFSRGTVILDQVVEISVPTSAGATVKSAPGLVPTTTAADGRQVYVWHYRNEKAVTGNAAIELMYARRNIRHDIQVTTFRDWSHLGDAFRTLWSDRATVTPDIQAKARALTAGLSTDEERVRALYGFVATGIRYVAIHMGVGRLRPHAASDVLASGFGDCKDKHTLFAALMRAVGLEADAALIGVGETVDPDVPSPSQFNHVISAVPTGAGGTTWFDATIDTAPAGFLVAGERDQQVLRIPDARPAALVKTPAEPARANVWHTETTGTISSEGALEATVRETVSGDGEVLLRSLLGRVPRTRWPDVVRAFPLTRIFGGTFTDVATSELSDTTQPFVMTYRFAVPSFSNWKTGSIYLPAALDIATSPSADGPAIPVPLGTTMEYVATARLELPASTAPQLAAGTEPQLVIERPYAKYESRVTAVGRLVTAERRWTIRGDEVPLSEVEDFRRFLTDVTAARYAVAVNVIRPWAWSDSPRIDWYAGATPAVTKTLQGAVTTARRGDYQEALAAVRGVLADQPDSDPAWQMKAFVELESGARERGLDTLRRRVPEATSPALAKYFAGRLHAFGRADEALEVWERGRAAFPGDHEFPLYYGEALLNVGRHHDAVAVFDAERERQSQSARFHVSLGRALAGAGRQDEASTVLLQAAALDESPTNLSNVATTLAEASVALDEALGFAERATQNATTVVNGLSLPELTTADLQTVAHLAQAWGARGWVLHRRGDTALAERHLLAAWTIGRAEEVARRLSALYAAAGNQEQALRFEALAIALLPVGSPAAAAANISVPIMAVSDARGELARMRRHDITRPVGVTAGQADFLVTVNAAGTVTGVRFARGDAALRAAAPAFVGAPVPWSSPDDALRQVVRRVNVDCRGAGSTCVLITVAVGDVTSLE